MAALAAVEHGEDLVLVVTPVDQTIADAGAFTAAMRQEIVRADAGEIVVLGIVPHQPETEYRYIKSKQSAAATPRAVERFEQVLRAL